MIMNNYLKKELSNNCIFLLNVDNKSLQLLDDYFKSGSIDEETYTKLRDRVNYIAYLSEKINPDIMTDIKTTAAYTGNMTDTLCKIIEYADYSNMLCAIKRTDTDYRLLEYMYRYIKSVIKC